ncbi:type II TA system antitoxin MqsA family protein [Radiobacillus sp. PE A8.2]|uniref:type II TA system antitoxin MqsA family protein n=1 Tax=Radiobacillus sp. PE A8.2 TaxID=3380349 RepID=UPI00388FB175
MSKVLWCEVCQKEVQPRIILKDEMYKYKGETIEVNAKVATCPICGTELPDDELDGAIMEEVQRIYMDRMDLTFEDIRNIRAEYGLSMELFAKILGWGKATVVRYEGGKVPSSSHISILKRLKEKPEELENYYHLNRDKFSEKEQVKIEKAFKNMDSEVIERTLIDVLKRHYNNHEQTIDAGFNSFSVDKVIQMILFFSESGVNKTVLLKYLFYSDFLYFKRSLISMSGLSYLKYKHGPVPLKYDLLLNTLQETGYIEIDEEDNEDFIRITIKSNDEFDEELFDSSELEVLQKVKEFFKGYGSGKISEFSHEEDGWKYTELNKIISYDYAERLQLD